MRDIKKYLSKKYKKGRAGVTWKNLSADILPGYAPGRIDLDSSRRDELNKELEAIAASGYIILRKEKKERAFTLYSLRFTEKMEDMCVQFGIRTKKSIANSIIDILSHVALTSPAVIRWQQEQLELAQGGTPDREFWNDSCDTEEIRKAVIMADAIIQNKEEIYIKNMAKRVLGDSKGFTGVVKTKACSLLEKCADADTLEELSKIREKMGKKASILALYNVVATPGYIPAFGKLGLSTPHGLITSNDMPYIFVSDTIEKYRHIRVGTPNFITVENRTTYEDFDEDGFTKFYVGGFPGYAERKLLLKIYEDNPEIRYFHWGDIDCGGFRIFNDIRKYIPVLSPYNMDKETLEKYSAYTTKLTESDRKHLPEITDPLFSDLSRYMLLHNIKLEQESIYA